VHVLSSVGAQAKAHLMQGSVGSHSRQGQGPPGGQHTQAMTVFVHVFATQLHPLEDTGVVHVTESEHPPPPSLKHGPFPRAPALMHRPRFRPGGKFSLQNFAHSLLPPSAAQATPGIEANAPPTNAAPSNLSALRLERVPLASPFASSSKEDASVASGLVWIP
jgi:hypothetical protein